MSVLAVRRYFLSIALVLHSAAAMADTSDTSQTTELTQRVDALFSAYDAGSPGCALGVIRNGELVYKKGYGNASLEFGVPIDPENTVFAIGSTSKQFTAAAILLLVQDGKISLTDDIRQYLPEMPNYGKAISIDHMLSHTSGLRDYTVLMTMGTGVREVDYSSDADAMAIILRQTSLNFAPGAHFMYSNTNYFLLAKIVERLSSQPFGTFLQERIFQPLNMRHTRVRDKYDVVVPQRAMGYAPSATDGYSMKDVNWEQVGNTGVLSTVSDLAKWDGNFYQPRVGGEWLVKQLQQNAIRRDGIRLSHARGLIVDGAYRGMRSVHHAGDTAAFHAQLFRLPEQRFSAVVLCNVDGVDQTLLSFKVADIFLADEIKKRRATVAQPGARPAARAPAPASMPSASELESYAGVYLERYSQSLHAMEARDGHLWYRAPQREPVALEPGGAQRFRLPGKMENLFQFSRQDKRALLTIGSGADEPLELVRVKPVQTDRVRLEDYAGTYFSPEINVHWTIVTKDGKLYKQAQREASKPMSPAFEDAYTVTIDDQELLRFTRNSRQRITGFIVDNPRVLNVVFSRTRSAAKAD